MPSAFPPLHDPGYRLFVERLVALRRAGGITQADLARRIGKPQSYVSKTERFERRIDPAEFYSLVTALGADPVSEFAGIAAMLDQEEALSPGQH